MILTKFESVRNRFEEPLKVPEARLMPHTLRVGDILEMEETGYNYLVRHVTFMVPSDTSKAPTLLVGLS